MTYPCFPLLSTLDCKNKGGRGLNQVNLMSSFTVELYLYDFEQTIHCYSNSWHKLNSNNLLITGLHY